MQRMIVPSTLLALAVLLSSSFLQAQEVPHAVNFQSVLRNDNGDLITDNFIDMQIQILDQNGDQLYAETQPGVLVVRGAVNIMIGEGVEPGSSTPTGGVPLSVLDPNSGTKSLQIQFGSNTPVGPIALGSVPYAMYSEVALNLDPDFSVTNIPGSFATQSELDTEITNRTNADVSLQSQITNEVNARATADTDLQNAITNEANTRAAADNAISTQIASKAQIFLTGADPNQTYSRLYMRVGQVNHGATIPAPQGYPGTGSCACTIAFSNTIQVVEGIDRIHTSVNANCSGPVICTYCWNQDCDGNDPDIPTGTNDPRAGTCSFTEICVAP